MELANLIEAKVDEVVLLSNASMAADTVLRNSNGRRRIFSFLVSPSMFLLPKSFPNMKLSQLYVRFTFPYSRVDI